MPRPLHEIQRAVQACPARSPGVPALFYHASSRATCVRSADSFTCDASVAFACSGKEQRQPLHWPRIMVDYAKWDGMVVSDDEDEDSGDHGRNAPSSPLSKARPDGPAACMEETPAELVARLTKLERLGEEVVTERQQMVELDRRRNLNREALASLRRAERTHGADEAAAQKRWLCLGDVFLKQSHGGARSMLEEDQRRIERELEKLRKSVKQKSSALCTLDPTIAGGSDIHRSFVSLHGVSATELERAFSAAAV